MTVSEKAWNRFLSLLRAIDDRAVTEMLDYIAKHPNWNTESGLKLTVDYAYALATKYGEASAAVACEMYDALATAAGAAVPAAIPAETATYGEVAKTVYGTVDIGSEKIVAEGVGRLVKTAGADTTLKNAIRDGAFVAWIPTGDTCAYCISMAARGWQKASKDTVKNGHAEHIHANCDCTYAVRFDDKSTVAGYAPEKYLTMYEKAPLDKWNTPDGKPPKGHEGAEKPTAKNRVNAMRRQFYAENKERINAEHRSAYAKRRERESSEAEEIDV